jgi:lactoylglutathione lyase
MKIDHIAIWTHNLEGLRAFYEQHFAASAGPKYVNPAKAFASYFLRFPDGPRLELMTRPNLIAADWAEGHALTGYAHLAFSVGSEAAVDALTERLRQAGYPPIDGPRRTGDGYYESVILDPDGNRIEITV